MRHKTVIGVNKGFGVALSVYGETQHFSFCLGFISYGIFELEAICCIFKIGSTAKWPEFTPTIGTPTIQLGGKLLYTHLWTRRAWRRWTDTL